MPNTPKALFVASGLSLLLAFASTQASAQGPRGSIERDIDRAATIQEKRADAVNDLEPTVLMNLEEYLDKFMKAIVQSYRTAVKSNLKNSETMREIVAEQRRADAIENRLRETPELLQTPKVPDIRPNNSPKLPEAVATTPVRPAQQAPQQPAEETRQQAPQQVPQQAPQVANNTPAQPAATTPPPAPVVGSARLSWSIPTQRENGDPLALTEIASYEIYVTAENAGTSRTIRVDNRNQTQFTLEPLNKDTYYFSMVTIDTEGTYSDLSQVVSKTIK